MSSAALCKLASDIGYRPTDRKLTPEALEWMFVYGDASKGFLNWFCQTITPKNILSDSEVQEYGRNIAYSLHIGLQSASDRLTILFVLFHGMV